MPRDAADILMYHSISAGPGPLSISPSTFRMQMQALSDCGFRGVSLHDYLSAPRTGSSSSSIEGAGNLAPVVVLTFDDGYADFADVVFPELSGRGWGCTVFVAPFLIGRAEGWDPDGSGPRTLMGWPDVQTLAGRGIEFGSHGLSHVDLTRIPPQTARAEIVDSKRALEERVRRSVTSFAPPFGRSTPRIRADIARHFRCAVGTTLGRASDADDLFDLPRIEMWYFREPGRWRRYLTQGPTAYFHARRLFRAVRRVAARSGLL